MPEETANDDRRKFVMIGKGIPVGIIMAILAQCAGFIWYGAKLDTRVQNQADKIQIIELWKEKQDDYRSDIKARLATVDQKLQDQADTLHRIDTRLESLVERGRGR